MEIKFNPLGDEVPDPSEVENKPSGGGREESESERGNEKRGQEKNTEDTNVDCLFFVRGG
jgi:hypothetical protein